MITIKYRYDLEKWELYEYAEQPVNDISHGFYETKAEAEEAQTCYLSK